MKIIDKSLQNQDGNKVIRFSLRGIQKHTFETGKKNFTKAEELC